MAEYICGLEGGEAADCWQDDLQEGPDAGTFVVIQVQSQTSGDILCHLDSSVGKDHTYRLRRSCSSNEVHTPGQSCRTVDI